MNEETVEDLYEHAPCGYVTTHPDGRIARVNQTLLSWTGYTREHLLSGVRFQSLLSIGSQIYYETHYAPLLRMQGAANEIALDLVCADRRVLPVLANARQQRDVEGRPVSNRITVVDATDRRRYERELLVARRRAEQIAKDKADLLAMLSHDIRNPLGALMGVVYLLERSGLNEAQRRHVQTIRRSSESMLDLLNRVLSLSQAEAGAFSLQEETFSLRQLVADVIGAYAAAASQKDVALHSEISDEVPEQVVGDPVALRQVLSNLIGNAVKFTSVGHVSVSVKVRDQAADAVTVAVAVSDTGEGIPVGRLERIFEEYTQASDDTARRYGGTGLGLAISRKLLALYGSSVDVESTEGQGSTFSFALRLALPAPAATPGPA